MSEFTYMLMEDGTYAVMSYDGTNNAVAIVPEYQGRPVTLLYDNLFKGHTELDTVAIPDTVTCLGGHIFDGCTSLKSVKLPSGLKDMWQYCFTDSSIEVIEIPGSVSAIIPHTFERCSSLQAVICHKGLQKIYKDAFKDCPDLAMFAVPSDTEVSHEAFEGCPKINPDLKGKLISTCQCPKCVSTRSVKKLKPFPGR